MKKARAYLFSMAFPRFGGPRGPYDHRLTHRSHARAATVAGTRPRRVAALPRAGPCTTYGRAPKPVQSSKDHRGHAQEPHRDTPLPRDTRRTAAPCEQSGGTHHG
ncbi:hypothetical protein GCM10017674_38090 [Streptomyces gardneri]|uniref:Uncharacterized protein n=1 Tax=Streptomyces gardneri TaxID=66892 RepID=A0A4Y3RYX4_9ACTN|nr:hypothetical protein SGA01_76080 [Streptomyces gardneri]GHH01629.1 hypothetical protein GCM10017674_38090 [Streptomyces gardneri]